MYDIAVCDDDAAFAARFQTLLTDVMAERNAACAVTLFRTPAEVLAAIENGARYALLFQDVLFDGERGIQFAKALRERRWDIDIVFVTNSPQYAVDGYDASPLGYLLKPVDRERLGAVVDRFLEKRAPNCLYVQAGKELFRLQLSDVLYFEVFDHEVVAHFADRGRVPFKSTLRELEGTVPAHLFVRCHRCYLINLAYVRKVTREQVIFPQGEAVPVSKRLYPQVLASLNDYADRNSLLFRQSGH